MAEVAFDPRTFRVLALDLGVHTGVAEWPAGATYSWALSGARPERLANLWTHLQVWWGTGDPFDLVVFERPFARGRAATRSLWGMAGVVEVVTQLKGLPSLDAEVQTIKKFATGKGGAGKDAMLAAAIARGWSPANDHEADAALICEYVINNLCEQRKLPSINLKELRNESPA